MKDEQPLVDLYLDGELTPEEQARLTEWLAADAEHVRQFVRETSLHRQIRETMLARPYHAVGLSEVESAEPKARPALVPVSVSRNQAVVAGDLRRRIFWRLSASLPGRRQFERAAKPVILALAASIVLVAGVCFFGPTRGEPMLAEVQGPGLSLERGGQSLLAIAGTRLQSRDVLRTLENASAVINFAPENTRITIEPGTELKLASISRGKRFDLGKGKLEATVARQHPFQPMIINTPQAEARVLGTKFSLLATLNETRLDVAEGNVRFTRITDTNSVRVGAGHYAVAAANAELAALPFAGTILREYFSGIKGKSLYLLLQDPSFPPHVDGWDLADKFELAPTTTNQLVVRFRGYLHPPASGDYEFWLAGATEAQLYISATVREEEKVQVAQVLDASAKSWDAPRFGGTSRWGPPVPLVAGRRYYTEALVLIKHGEGHLSVAWKGPDRPRELITGRFLSPCKSRQPKP